eukprot:CAMPEP_0194176206 /NCGR_PEP_ID=MMETSP0154-20130528/10150_1 /TAXON_ID=1049557 /ORGANISM="Thalassiothrix antarctica, Strain L6-D1" /LENGTH=233 /DNA_ID=CAMNT_0038890299 /DNA_START=21 /DNA_END=722 /DNA_ORIENTATION=-
MNDDNNNDNNSNSNDEIPPVQTPPRQKSIYQTIMSNPRLTSLNYTAENAMHRPVQTYGNGGEYSLGNLTMKSLPYFQPWCITAPPNAMPPNYDWLTESCAGRAAMGVFGGGVMGLLMGVFLGAMSDGNPIVTVVGDKEVPQHLLKEQMGIAFRSTYAKSIYWCKSFAFITGVFGGSECLVEKYRGKHDIWNPVMSGCITGAAIQAKSGPQAAAVGCGGFAAFSLVIDTFMGHY